MFKYARIKIMYSLLKPVQGYFRRKRMARFNEFLRSLDGGYLKVLDLGGQPAIWEYVDRPLDIVILNLPGVADRREVGRHKISYVEGDACNLSAYGDREFDVVFSNSVIEHVGGREKVGSFCSEAMRVGKTVWVQTPSKYFPIEPHTGMPFWWYYPEWLKKYLIERWQRKLPAWTDMVKSTTYVDKEKLISKFPGCHIYVERFFGIPKSYTAIIK